MGRSSVLVLVAALIVLLVGVTWWTSDPIVHVPATVAASVANDRSGVAVAAFTADRALVPTVPDRQEVPAAELPEGDGSLIVRARHVRGDLPAAGMNFRLNRIGAEPGVIGRARADASGVATFAGVRSGVYQLHNDRRDRARSVTIAAGETSEIDFAVQIGIRFAGSVVDVEGRPLAGAHVMLWMQDEPSEQNLLAVADADGAFTVLDAYVDSAVGAHAPGHRASAPLRLRQLHAGGHNRLVLGRHGVEATGFVVDPTGAPIAEAVVEIGDLPSDMSWPAIARTDRFGRFHAFGLAAGTLPLRAHAPGRSPQQTTIEVLPEVPLQRIVLQSAASLRGVVVDLDGQSVRGARVRILEPGGSAVVTDRDGVFEIPNAPIGSLRVEAWLGSDRVESRVTTVAGHRSTVELRFAVAVVGPASPR